MAKYEVTAPDGKKYQIDAPEGASHDDVLAFAAQSYKSASPDQGMDKPSSPAMPISDLANNYYAAQASGDTQAQKDAYRQIRAQGSQVPNPTPDQLGASVGQVANPTEGQNFFQNAVQGFGEGFNDLGRGVKQLGLAGGSALGIPGATEALKQSQTDHTEAVRNDQYLNDTAGGVTGYGGSLAAQAVVPIGAAGKAASLGGRVAGAAATGAALSQLNPVGEGDFATQKAVQGAVGGAVGGAFPVAGKIASGVAQRVFPEVDPVSRKLASRASQLGIEVTPAQLSDSKFTKALKSVVNKFPLSGADAAMRGQQNQFNNAVGKTIGVDVKEITPEVMDKARDAIGSEFDRVAKNTTLNIDPDFTNRISGIFQEMGDVLPADETRPLGNLINKIVDVSQGGQIPGKAYQAITAKGAPLNALQNAQNPTVRMYANQIRSALDDALERSSTPEDVASLRQARSQYKNLKTIEDLVEKSPTGDISPALLLGQVRNSFNNMAYGGGGDLADLARIGQRFLKDSVPDSGTALRSGIQNSFDRFGNAVASGSIASGAGGAALAGAPILTTVLPSAAAVVGAGRAVRSYLDNPKVAQAMLRRSAAARKEWENIVGQLGYGAGTAAAPAEKDQ